MKSITLRRVNGKLYSIRDLNHGVKPPLLNLIRAQKPDNACVKEAPGLSIITRKAHKIPVKVKTQKMIPIIDAIIVVVH